MLASWALNLFYLYYSGGVSTKERSVRREMWMDSFIKAAFNHEGRDYEPVSKGNRIAVVNFVEEPATKPTNRASAWDKVLKHVDRVYIYG